MLEAIRRLLHRRRCLRAWRTDIERESGSAQARADIAHRYNRWRFWWQRELPIPTR